MSDYEKQVYEYLLKEYHVSEPRAKELVEKNKHAIEVCDKDGNDVYFPADCIAEEVGLEPKELGDDFDDEEFFSDDNE